MCIRIISAYITPRRAAQILSVDRRLLLILLIPTLLLLRRRRRALALDATRAATAIRRGQRKVDVLLRVETDDEGGDVDDLAADAGRGVSVM
jgi:hypothetical protein